MSLSLTVTCFLILVTATGVSAQPVYGAKCLDRLAGTAAIARDGKVRFALHDLNAPYPRDRADTIIAIEPGRLDLTFFSCAPRLAPSGAIQTGGVTFIVDGKAANSAGIKSAIGRFYVSVSDMWPDAIRWGANLSLRQKSWEPRGKQFGLDRYQQIVGVKDGKKTKDVRYLGANYVGETASGHFLRISCVDFDLSLIVFCRMTVQIKNDVMLTIEIPTKNLARWPEYSALAEVYFNEHVE